MLVLFEEVCLSSLPFLDLLPKTNLVIYSMNNDLSRLAPTSYKFANINEFYESVCLLRLLDDPRQFILTRALHSRNK